MKLGVNLKPKLKFSINKKKRRKTLVDAIPSCAHHTAKLP